MSPRFKLSPQQRLHLLQEHEPLRPWHDLDEERFCILCEKTFTGRRVRFTIAGDRSAQLHCPTRNCSGTPAEWVYAGSPLLSEESWQDWLLTLDQNHGEAQKQTA